MAAVSRSAVFATLGSRDQTAVRAQPVKRGSTRILLALLRAWTVAQASTSQLQELQQKAPVWHARKNQVQLPGVIASKGAIATPDTARRQATICVFSAVLASTTTQPIGTRAPSAGGGSSPRPQVRQPPKHASRAPLAIIRMRAARSAIYALQTRIHLRRQIPSPIAPAMLEQQGPTGQRAGYAQRGNTRQSRALQHA